MDGLDAVLQLEDQGQVVAELDLIVPDAGIVKGPFVERCLEVLADRLVFRSDDRQREPRYCVDSSCRSLASAIFCEKSGLAANL